MNKRIKNKQNKAADIFKSNDPLTIAKHLFKVLNEQGYNTKSWDSIGDFHSIDIRRHTPDTGGNLEIENLAQGWTIKEEPINYYKRDEKLPF